MTGAEFVIKVLKKFKVTDAFGIPGAVILELLYAFEKYGITPHLCYHEQSAGFAACGYAQAKGSLGIAYATKGPGFTNLITAIADAYYDSVPLIFITAHTMRGDGLSARFIANQEIDTVQMVSKITKYAAYIETEDQLLYEMEAACKIALENRKGPVLLDFNSRLLEQNVSESNSIIHYKMTDKILQIDYVKEFIIENIKGSKRPVILIGNGIKQNRKEEEIKRFCEKNMIPVLSSRVALDCIADSDYYFGYIGSRGLRFSNFILGKCDMILSIGNRMAYNLLSESFKPIMKEKKIIRIEVDEHEFDRKIPNAVDFKCDLNDVLEELKDVVVEYAESSVWIQTCSKLREQLFEYDVNEPVKKMADILQMLPKKATLICDVGDNALWFSKAYNFSRIKNRVIFSMGLSCLGNALCKSIGVCFVDSGLVVCITGDQGMQMNIQELEFFSYNKLPVLIILINNRSSGMIGIWEKEKYSRELHVSSENGYGTPDFEQIAKAYRINYIEYSSEESVKKAISFCEKKESVILNVLVSPLDNVLPSLGKGDPCYRLSPDMPYKLYKELLDL